MILIKIRNLTDYQWHFPRKVKGVSVSRQLMNLQLKLNFLRLALQTQIGDHPNERS